MQKKYLIIFISVVLIFNLSGAEAADKAEKKVEQTLEEECPSGNWSIPLDLYDKSNHRGRPDRGYIIEICGAKSSSFLDHVSFDVEFDFLSKYVWRGLASSEGAVWQPSVVFEAYGFGISVWSNFVLDDEPNQGNFNEVDFVPYYTYTINGFTISPSFEYYIYPGSDPRSLDYSSEPSVRTALHLAYTYKALDLFADGEVDLYSAKGALYFDFGVGFHYQLMKPLKFATSMLFGIGDGRFNKAHIADVGTKLNLVEYSISFSWNAWKALTFTPNFHISTLASGQLRDAVNDPTIVWGGLDIVYNF